MELLRQSTTVLHQRVENAFNLQEALSSKLAYVDLLRRLQSFIVPIERELRPFAQAIPGLRFDTRRKAPLLAADLVRLTQAGFNTSTASPAVILPPIMSRANALGCLYVLEGSTLGGSIISKALRTQLNIGPMTGGGIL
jgi:heme oxygenase (biliverdin-IX-beta and delta-forming)